jgi:L-alanine-DL-glutamate epimerase-like enolase superfamily enzyme
MKITDIRADTLAIGPTLVRVYTDEGVVGLSDLSWHDPRIFAAYLDDVIKPLLVGEDPLRPERHLERLIFGTHLRPYTTPIPLAGVIDIALWDIVGKVAGQPIHALLGGAARTDVELYWSVGAGWRKTPDEMAADLRRGLDQGFGAFKIRMDWGVLRSDEDPVKDRRMAEVCRDAVGGDAWIGFDANRGYSVGQAIRHGRRLEELGYAHFEEPLAPFDLSGLRQVVDALDIPISSGEDEQGHWRFRDLITLGNPDILQPDIVDCGGISEVVRIFRLADAHGKPVMPHSPSAGILSMASLQAYATVRDGIRPHEYSTEYGPPPDQIAELFEEVVRPEGGRMHLSDRPGLGLTLREHVVDRLRVASA